MRPLLAAIVVVVILGGLQLYMSLRHWYGPAAAEAIELAAPGEFSLEITTTFDLGGEPDPFASEVGETATLSVTFRDKELIDSELQVQANTPIVVSPVEELVVGHDEFSGRNEFFVSAVVPAGDPQTRHAVRFQLRRDDDTIVDQTFWGRPGEKLSGRVIALIVESAESPAHNH